VALRLYSDECVDARIVAGLRRRGVDVLTAGEQGLLSASDAQQIERATALGRALVTADQDFLVIVREMHARGMPFPGVFFIQEGTLIGEAVRNIADAAEILEPADMVSWLEWIP
jgi:predicted nuclease of predicted toxin-antitoxin system